MLKGYSKLLGTKADALHFVNDGDYFYSLSFSNSQKIRDINEGKEIYAIAEIEEQEKLINITGPLNFDSLTLTEENKKTLVQKYDARKIEVELIDDFSKILSIQEKFKNLEFNYFPDAYIKENEIVLLKYKFI